MCFECEKHLLRLCSLRRFGYLIASLSQSQANSGGARFFEYDSRRALFVDHEQALGEKKSETAPRQVTPPSKPDAEVKKTSAASLPAKDERKLQLMKSMAQLRLEVNQNQVEAGTGEKMGNVCNERPK